MAGKHAGGGESTDGDRLPGQPWDPDTEPTGDGSAPAGGGRHRKVEQDEDTA